MASKIKVDTIETANGSGTIALSNQLSGMTTASLPTLTAAEMPTGSVLQVKQAVLTTSSAASIEGWYDITGLSLAITPTSSSSKILIQANVFGAVSNAGWLTGIRILRDSTALAVGTSGSSATNNFASVAYMAGSTAEGDGKQMVADILDSPSTASAITYKVQYVGGNTGVITYINRLSTSSSVCAISTITLTEIQG